MAEINWSDPAGATSYLTTELNSLADGAGVLGAAIGNGDGKRWALIEVSLATQGSARDNGAHVDIYVVRSADDGTTYDYGAASPLPGGHALAGSIEFDAATTARVGVCEIALPPGYFKLLVLNNTGQAWGATGNTVRHNFFSEETN